MGRRAMESTHATVAAGWRLSRMMRGMRMKAKMYPTVERTSAAIRQPSTKDFLRAVRFSCREPPRGFESPPLRHPTLLEVRSGRSGTSRLRRVSSEAPKRRVFGCREERRWAGLTAEGEGVRTGAAADESNRLR